MRKSRDSPSTDSHIESIVKCLFSLVFGAGAIVLTFNDISTCEKNHFSVRKCKQCEFNGTINTTVLTMTWWRDGTLSIMIKIKILFSSMIWLCSPPQRRQQFLANRFTLFLHRIHRSTFVLLRHNHSLSEMKINFWFFLSRQRNLIFFGYLCVVTQFIIGTGI